MNTSDIETDLRTVFARMAEDAPEVIPAVLGELSTPERGLSPWLRRAAPFAAAAGVAGALFAATSLGVSDRPESVDVPSVAAAPSAGASPGQVQALVGTWMPVQLEGRLVVGDEYRELPLLQFAPEGIWKGTDGCLPLEGRYHLGTGGGRISIDMPSRRRGLRCTPDETHPLFLATRFRVSAKTLELFDEADHLVATYRRHGPVAHREE